eukprot:515574-Pyramimonas_sp.AAC.1
MRLTLERFGGPPDRQNRSPNNNNNNNNNNNAPARDFLLFCSGLGFLLAAESCRPNKISTTARDFLPLYLGLAR